ncbi:VIT1/CCC1 transporter family protein [Chroococcidiopsis thermalis]|uniref:Iron transporter n=1 Tax=Chroococcidiopsis thermalis (strain PCC 7203) TaxID=251229 RepID=K9U8M8_CHRTP|nr:VIT1/CCC1 transporter family protein [Chroococcidiopsis thermalis]AFY90983.1 protein of unknown function DUF125 transmembrane [Chroococcidiopsis thermalis PCC 7203]
MPQTPHVEEHFTASEVVRDIVIGVSDGLTVPFALAAGLSGTVASTSIVVTAGLAEIAAGAIAMGLGGYLAAKSDADHYTSELKREQRELREKPGAEVTEVIDIFQSYGLTAEESKLIAKGLLRNPHALVNFMMRFELGIEKPAPRRALKSALTIASSYIAGGIVPLSPFIFISNSKTALTLSVIITNIVLVIFGYIKGHFTGAKPMRSAVQTVLTGGLAAAAAFSIAKLISR